MTDSDVPASARPLVAVLDYGIGNLRSAQKALERQGADARLTADLDLARRADGVVLPGVGAFGRCAQAIRDAGLHDVVADSVAAGVPFLGICIGMQLLYEESEEDPGAAGLGVLDGAVRRLPGKVKVPQMQWNQLERPRPSGLWAGLADPAWVYFNHSYAVVEPDPARVIGVCDYGGAVTAAVEFGPRQWAVQFHPEKSGAAGLHVLSTFVAACRA
ncbi:MAG: imidazole glycerol phosphate synthase subunit HisH [Acidimicrobiales bacterium]